MKTSVTTMAQTQYCEKTFTTAGSMMKAHALCHLTEQPHPCPQCDNFFRTVYDLSHQLVTRPFLCEKCPKAFRTARILHNHKVHHMEDSDHAFEDCNKTPHHLKLHSEDKPYVCPDRGKGFLWPTASPYRRTRYRAQVREDPCACGRSPGRDTLMLSTALNCHLDWRGRLGQSRSNPNCLRSGVTC